MKKRKIKKQTTTKFEEKIKEEKIYSIVYLSQVNHYKK